MKNSWIFPGQASQKIGMGKDLYDKTEIGKKYYNIANEILEADIQSISFNGPEEILKKTKYTQPAIFIVSAIIGHAMIEKGYTPDIVAGHSLGEYSALVVAGAFDFSTGLELVKLRAESMQNAGKVNRGTMAAIIGLSSDDVNNLCDEISTEKIVVVANYNTKNQIVVSGHIEAVENLMISAKEFGAKMVIPLNVSGAFHSPLMSPAREALADKLDSIQISDILYPLYTNVDAKPITKGEEIKKSLIRQLENPVQWHNVIQKMINNGSDHFTEIGPGKVLQGLNRKIDKNVSTKGIQTYEDILNYNV
jgi:[acyl-carrier-protein] S-malonyltransferase